MTLESRNRAALAAGQARYDAAEPPDDDVAVAVFMCKDCTLIFNSDMQTVDGQCPECESENYSLLDNEPDTDDCYDADDDDQHDDAAEFGGMDGP